MPEPQCYVVYGCLSLLIKVSKNRKRKREIEERGREKTEKENIIFNYEQKDKK